MTSGSSERPLGEWLAKNLLPRPEPDAVINPSEVFDGYERDLAATRSSELRLGHAGDYLSTAWRLYENEEARKASIDSRATTTLGSVGVVVALVLTLGGAESVDAFRGGAWGKVVLALVLVGLGYLVSTIYFAVAVLRPRTRHTVGPTEMLPARYTAAGRGYGEIIASNIVGVTVENYRIDNGVNERLRVAQMSLRNALVLLIMAASLVIVARGLDRPTETTCSLELRDATEVVTIEATCEE